MNTIAKLTFGAFLLAGPLAIAGQGKDTAPADPSAAAVAPDAEDSQGRIVLEEPAATVKEAMERRAAREAEAMEELEAAKKAYEDRMAAANQRTVNNLELIARRAVADGQLPEASKAWEEVLRMDPENEGAVNFFETIDQLDAVRAKIVSVEDQLIGSWKWCTGAEMEIRAGGTRYVKLENRSRKLKLKWKYEPRHQILMLMDSRGEVTDQVKITHGGQMIEGVNRTGDQVWGVRMD